MFDTRLFPSTKGHKPKGPKPQQTDQPSFRGAIKEAMQIEMRNDPNVFQMGEDIALASPFGVTTGLVNEFGKDRIRDAPCSEVGVIGAAVGAAIGGMRPIVELQFGDFMSVAIDQLTHQAAMLRYLTGGQVQVPMVIRLPCGAGQGAGSQHSQTLYSWFAHAPGIKVALPSTSDDAKGLMRSAIQDNNPVLFFEHKMLYRSRWDISEDYHNDDFIVPFGKAKVHKAGSDVTIVATLTMLHYAKAAADELEAEGISVEVIDPRTIAPLDTDTIIQSVEKTGRLLVVDEAYLPCGIQGEVIATVTEKAFSSLKAAPVRMGNPGVPVPFAPPLEAAVIPNKDNIIEAVRTLMNN